MSTVANVVAFVVGVVIIQAVLRSAIWTVVVPRNEQVLLTRVVFLLTRSVYVMFTRRRSSAVKRHEIMARYAPTTLIVLAVVWVFLVFVGFIPIYWAVGSISFHEAVLLSGSSITTLGFVAARSDPTSSVAYVEAIIGLGLLAMLISYLPTIYGHFSRREAEVVKLESRAGTPPWSGTMIRRYHSIGSLERMSEAWPAWQQWFVEIQESHTSQLALPLFRSQDPRSSWVTSAGAVLDAAALSNAAIDLPTDPEVALMIRAGFLSLRSIAESFDVPLTKDPNPNDPISVSRAEFEELLDEFAEAGVPIKSDREQAWKDFAGWRVNYDLPLLALSRICVAPPARWSSDRVERFRPPTLFHPNSWDIGPLTNPPSW
ncbi:MAG: hypothetical protein WBF71_06190 [Microthrixaceae bacterium]